MKLKFQQLGIASIVLVAPFVGSTEAIAQQVTTINRQDIQLNENVQLTPACTPWFCNEVTVIEIDEEILRPPICDPRVCDPPRDFTRVREPLRQIETPQVENIRGAKLGDRIQQSGQF